MERAVVVCEGEKSRRSRQRWFSVARPLLLFTRLQVAVVLAMERGRTGRGGVAVPLQQPTAAAALGGRRLREPGGVRALRW